MTFPQGLEPAGLELRRAEADDADLVRRVLCIAIGWRDEPAASVPAGLGAYHEDWGRPDDIGMLAFLGVEFVGGACARRMDAADGTFGFVDSALWELSLGVEPAHRGRGIGRLLLEALKAQAMERGIAGLSLSVETDNPAAGLYAAARFTVVEEREGDLLMMWHAPGGSAR